MQFDSRPVNKHELAAQISGNKITLYEVRSVAKRRD